MCVACGVARKLNGKARQTGGAEEADPGEIRTKRQRQRRRRRRRGGEGRRMRRTRRTRRDVNGERGKTKGKQIWAERQGDGVGCLGEKEKKIV